MDCIEVGKSYYYTGENIKAWKNVPVSVLKLCEEKVGTNKDVLVYLCEDNETKKVKKVIASNLSLVKCDYKYAYGGMKECFPEDVERFPTFKNGKYALEYTWGKY